jgi:hypothetical protein
MQAFHEREIVLVLNCADLTLCEVFTNDPELARQLELAGCRRDYVLFEPTSLRANLSQSLPHLFVLPKQSVVLGGLAVVEHGYEQIAWRRVSAETVQAKLAEIRKEKQRRENAERSAYERSRVAQLSPERKAELTAQRRERRASWTPAQKEAHRQRQARWFAGLSEEQLAQRREAKRLREIARRAKRGS